MSIFSSLRRDLKKIGYTSFNTVSKPIGTKSSQELQRIALALAETMLPPGHSIEDFVIQTHHFVDPMNHAPLHLDAQCLRNTNGGIISIASISETLTSIPLINVYVIKKSHKKDLVEIITDVAEQADIILEAPPTKPLQNCIATA